MPPANDPIEITLAAHREYYAQGGYDDGRLKWTISEFLASQNFGRALQVGCGDGAMLELMGTNCLEVVGVDASSSGIQRCLSRGVQALCLDISTDGLPFPDDSFDVIVSLETFEHLMNPHFAFQEIRRTLRPGGKFLCSVPNPLTGHPYLYPGLFEYRRFRSFLEQSGFEISRVAHWEWTPREVYLPPSLRRVPVLNGRTITRGLRRLTEKGSRAVGAFPYFCYWLGTFDCRNNNANAPSDFEKVSEQTRPGSTNHFSPAS